MNPDDVVAQAEKSHRCIVCWITKQPYEFKSEFELLCHRIARHGEEPAK